MVVWILGVVFSTTNKVTLDLEVSSVRQLLLSLGAMLMAKRQREDSPPVKDPLMASHCGSMAKLRLVRLCSHFFFPNFLLGMIPSMALCKRSLWSASTPKAIMVMDKKMGRRKMEAADEDGVIPLTTGLHHFAIALLDEGRMLLFLSALMPKGRRGAALTLCPWSRSQPLDAAGTWAMEVPSSQDA
jgi:hypothetical protein